MQYNVFDTEQEAIDAEHACFLAWKSTKDQSSLSYWAVTLFWDKVIQRQTDSKWVYRVCPEGSQSHTQETYSSDWFSDPEL